MNHWCGYLHVSYYNNSQKPSIEKAQGRQARHVQGDTGTDMVSVQGEASAAHPRC